MAEAFGVEQQTQIQGFNPNPNNRGVTKPRGIDVNLNAIAKNIGTGLADAAERADESGIVTSIQNARDKMRVMEAGGKTPVEIARFRDEAASIILRRFPSAAAINMVKTGLRETIAQSTRILADGTSAVVDKDGNILSIVPESNPDTALKSIAMAEAINVSANLQNFSNAAELVLNKATENGIDVSAVTVQGVALVSERFKRYDARMIRLQQDILTHSPEEGRVAAEMAKRDIMGDVVQGLQSLGSPAMMELLRNTNSGILPSDITQLADAYIGDWLETLTNDSSFSVLDLSPKQFREDLKAIAKNLTEQAQANFEGDNILAERRRTEGDILRNTNEDDVWNNMRQINPEAHRIAVLSEVIGDLASSIDVATELQNKYNTTRGPLANHVETTMRIIAGEDAVMEMISSSLPLHTFVDRVSVLKYKRMVNELVKTANPVAIAAVRNDWLSRDSANFKDDYGSATAIMAEHGSVQEQEDWAIWLTGLEGYSRTIADIEKATKTDLNQAVQSIGRIRSQVTGGVTDETYDSIGAPFKRLTKVPPGEAKPPKKPEDVTIK